MSTQSLSFSLTDNLEIRKIVETSGISSAIDFFRLMSDKSYFLSKSRKTVITYKIIQRIAICLGDPLGPHDELEQTISEFLSFCQTGGLKVAFLYALPENLPLYKKFNLNKIKIGEEALVNLDYFFSHTIKKEDFGRTYRKFDKLSFRTRSYYPPFPPDLLEEMEQISKEWLNLLHHREYTFAQGQFDKAFLNFTPLFTVHDPQGKLIAFVNQIPSFQKEEATIDLMRYRSCAPNGTMDYLFTKLFMKLYSEGYAFFNLGLAPLSYLGDGQDCGIEEKIAKNFLKLFNHYFSATGLRDYKDKFDPVWESRYLVYSGSTPQLIRTIFAIKKAIQNNQ